MERAQARDQVDASVERGGGVWENAKAHGRYEVECVGADGRVKWRDIADNVVTTVGKNLALDIFLAGSGYTVVGPYIGLISASSFTRVDLSDTMVLHPGWIEAGLANLPTYGGGRKVPPWVAASAGMKGLSSIVPFAMTNDGIIAGIFMCFGPGAVVTVDDTNGTLWSAGTFAGGNKPVVNGDTLKVNYSVSL